MYPAFVRQPGTKFMFQTHRVSQFAKSFYKSSVHYFCRHISFREFHHIENVRGSPNDCVPIYVRNIRNSENALKHLSKSVSLSPMKFLFSHYMLAGAKIFSI